LNESQTVVIEESYDDFHFHHFDCDLDTDASGRLAHLAAQQKLGLLPERRTWIGRTHSAHSTAHGTPLIIRCWVSEEKTK
jgi:hypothetical protein